MTTTYYSNQIASIEKEIADLQKKIADEAKKEYDCQNRISSIERSITRYTSMSSLQSKQRDIQNQNKKIIDCKKKQAGYQKKIADKTKTLRQRKIDLQKEEKREQEKRMREEKTFQDKLQKDIQQQKSILNTLVEQNYSAKLQNEMSHVEDKQYDFFISHASEDKENFVKALAEGLTEEGCKVWYDNFVLKIGDSLRESIDRGLANSKYGIVVISPYFLKKRWPAYELNGMVAREMNGHKVILPIWHKVTKDEVLQYSPTLADKLALNTAIHSMKEIIEQLKTFVISE